MSSMDQMKEGFLTLLGIMPRTSRLQYLSVVSQSTKSSSLMKQTIPLPTYNSFLERVLRSSPTTVDSFLPVITRTKSLNPSTADVYKRQADVLSLSLESKESKSKKSQHAFSSVLTQFWNKKE